MKLVIAIVLLLAVLWAGYYQSKNPTPQEGDPKPSQIINLPDHLKAAQSGPVMTDPSTAAEGPAAAPADAPATTTSAPVTTAAPAEPPITSPQEPSADPVITDAAPASSETSPAANATPADIPGLDVESAQPPASNAAVEAMEQELETPEFLKQQQ